MQRLTIVHARTTCSDATSPPLSRTLGIAGRHESGFTLLEMVVVLAIMALVVGVASLRIFTMIQSWRERTQLDGIEQQFSHLPVAAREFGRAIELPPPTSSSNSNGLSGQGVPVVAVSPYLVLPDDWKVTFDRPLRIRETGFCEGAKITIQHDAHRYERNVTAPFCQVASTDGEGSR